MIRQTETFYMAPVDAANKATTMTAIVLLGLAVATGLVLLSGAFGSDEWLPGEARQGVLFATGVVTASLVFVFLLMWAVYRPLRIEISEAGVRICWAVRKTLIRAEDIKAVCPGDGERVGHIYRIAGMGGVGGTFGLCRSRELGFVSVYATRRDGAVLIERTEGRPFLITSDQPEAFIKAVSTLMAS